MQSADQHLRARLADEFPAGAHAWPPDLSRRHFLELMGASLALAGVAGCYRPPREDIVPYGDTPEALVPGNPLTYATAMPWHGFARGILVRAHEGRPIKIEGNPAHPDSLGATDAITQAAVLGLYDPDRSTTPVHQRVPVSWADFDAAWRNQRARFDTLGGDGFALLTEPTTSPTQLRLVHALLDHWPHARWYQAPTLLAHEVEADLSRADVILAIDDDILVQHPGSLRHARHFAARRRESPNRLYVAEPSPTVTGSMADRRLPATPAECRALLETIASQLEHETPSGGGFVAQVTRDLREAGPRGRCFVGAHLGPQAQKLADRINRLIGVTPPPTHRHPRSDNDPRATGDLTTLAADIDNQRVHTLVVLDRNIVYTEAGGRTWPDRIGRLASSIHLGAYHDETGQACQWHLPTSHFLESWNDLRSSDGTATIAQPASTPRLNTRAPLTLLDQLARGSGRSDYALVRETWDAPPDDWSEWLRRGTVPRAQDNVRPPAPPSLRRGAPPAPPLAGDALVAVFRPDRYLDDGRWANNGWLQELPDPFSRLAWGNAAWISSALARKHGLNAGDHVVLTCEDRTLEIPVWIQPGQAGSAVTLHFGYGRRAGGHIAQGVGVNVFPFQPPSGATECVIHDLRSTGRHTDLISTQGHFDMAQRDLVRVVPAAEADHPPTDALSPQERSTLFPAAFPEGEYAWAMAIDLRSCMGCQACVIACQAENNIPVVGAAQVARGREMHWIRIDRYYTGDETSPLMLHQPVPCMHCENAPCELVCPVGATVHSSEGLNDMVYNRCIGTRYCSNNCPYKVRRFNFLNFRVDDDSPLNERHNPRVTVRERGVMEKCTYCVQRINAARIVARREDRRIRENELRTACQQVCPTEAIVFGDKNDPASAVSRRRAHPLNYALLTELNTQPRTTYLARVTNRAPEDAPA